MMDESRQLRCKMFCWACKKVGELSKTIVETWGKHRSTCRLEIFIPYEELSFLTKQKKSPKRRPILFRRGHNSRIMELRRGSKDKCA